MLNTAEAKKQKILSQSLKDSLLDIIREINNDFPEIIEKLIITCDDSPLFAGGNLKKTLINNPLIAKDLVLKRKKTMEERNAIGVCNKKCRLSTKNKKTVHVISIKKDNEFLKAKNNSAIQIVLMIHVIFHELGHLLVKNGNAQLGKNQSECAADVYAAIQLKRYGLYELFKKTDRYKNQYKRIPENRSPVHYTKKALETLETLSDKKILKASTKRILEIADIISEKRSIKDDKLKRIIDMFNDHIIEVKGKRSLDDVKFLSNLRESFNEDIRPEVIKIAREHIQQQKIAALI